MVLVACKVGEATAWSSPLNGLAILLRSVKIAGMLFKAAILQKIFEGEVIQAFRHCRRPSVRAGGTLRTAIGVLAIDKVERVERQALTPQDAQEAGFATIEALCGSIPSRGEGRLYRIRFRRLGDDPREALRENDALDAADLVRIDKRLARLDRDRPWTKAVLDRIGQRDGITAGEIAAAFGIDKAKLKRLIRQLKELGLTESLVSGYRLSPRGRAVQSRRLGST